jgi:hypothetical protein
VADAKRYFEALYPIGASTEQLAVAELVRLMGAPEFQRAVSEYAAHGHLPWQRENGWPRERVTIDER